MSGDSPDGVEPTPRHKCRLCPGVEKILLWLELKVCVKLEFYNRRLRKRNPLGKTTKDTRRTTGNRQGGSGRDRGRLTSGTDPSALHDSRLRLPRVQDTASVVRLTDTADGRNSLFRRNVKVVTLPSLGLIGKTTPTPHPRSHPVDTTLSENHLDDPKSHTRFYSGLTDVPKIEPSYLFAV